MTKANGRPAVNETRIRVRYAETDQMGVVYHANHFIWFEIGRVELLRQLGFSYKEMEEHDNCFIAVVDARGDLIALGRMPVSPALPYEWYETPNVHQCTIVDFEDGCRRLQLRIRERLSA